MSPPDAATVVVFLVACARQGETLQPHIEMPRGTGRLGRLEPPRPIDRARLAMTVERPAGSEVTLTIAQAPVRSSVTAEDDAEVCGSCERAPSHLGEVISPPARCRLSSWRATDRRWTSSGPSARCRVRTCAHIAASGASPETPAPPCAWMARSMT